MAEGVSLVRGRILEEGGATVLWFHLGFDPTVAASRVVSDTLVEGAAVASSALRRA